mmetsp:Transcript_2452/g.6588  ORF Transcript_2452/g.6588 Transcript_2452/m.6588 type:complete len:436 (+) Transcript_2452:711-2018(+)
MRQQLRPSPLHPLRQRVHLLPQLLRRRPLHPEPLLQRRRLRGEPRQDAAELGVFALHGHAGLLEEVGHAVVLARQLLLARREPLALLGAHVHDTLDRALPPVAFLMQPAFEVLNVCLLHLALVAELCDCSLQLRGRRLHLCLGELALLQRRLCLPQHLLQPLVFGVETKTLLLHILKPLLRRVASLRFADGFVLLLRQLVSESSNVEFHLVADALVFLPRLAIVVTTPRQLLFGLGHPLLAVLAGLCLLLARLLRLEETALGLVQGVLGSEELVLALSEGSPQTVELVLVPLALFLQGSQQLLEATALVELLLRAGLGGQQVLFVRLDLWPQAGDFLLHGFLLLLELAELATEAIDLLLEVTKLLLQFGQLIFELLALHPCHVLGGPAHEGHLVLVVLAVHILALESEVDIGSDLAADQLPQGVQALPNTVPAIN